MKDIIDTRSLQLLLYSIVLVGEIEEMYQILHYLVLSLIYSMYDVYIVRVEKLITLKNCVRACFVKL